MKKSFFIIKMVLMLGISTGIQAANEIAVVNITNIFQQLPARETVAKQLENEFAGRSAELEKMEGELRAKMEKLRSEGKLMKASDRTGLEKEISQQRERFTEKATKFEEDSRRRQMEERNKILNRIQDAVKSVASKKDYAVVIDANAVIYAKPALDITDEVQKQVK